MMKTFGLIYLFSIIISVKTNPLAQLVQSCPACQPVYSNPTSLPVVVQQPNNNPYPQAATVESPSQGSFGDTLNQIILNRILTNPSLQKIIDPNTKLYNQNGEEINRQIATGPPNVVNNYFIVPPEFFNLNETVNNDESNEAKVYKKRHRTKSRRPIIVETEDGDDDIVIVTKKASQRRIQEPIENPRRKIKRIKDVVDDENDESLEITPKKEKDRNTRRHRLKIKNKRKEMTPTYVEESDEDIVEPEIIIPFKEKKRRKEPKRLKNIKSKSKIISSEDDTKHVVVKDKNVEVIVNEPEKEPIIEVKKSKKERCKDINQEETYLKNIELPTDVANQDLNLPESKKVRGSKRNAAKKEQIQKTSPIPDELLRNYFPYMPMGNYYNTNANYPYNFDNYYQYLDPLRNSNTNRNKKSRINQDRKPNPETPKQKHTIEIKIKPKKKENTTENPVNDVPNKEDLKETTDPIENEPTTESYELEIVTDIPMQLPHAVSPIGEDESSSKESYETFSELEALRDYSPKLGEEDEVPTMHSNAIINDYFPVFYNSDVETLSNLEDDRYFYESKNEEELGRERRRNDKYEDFSSKRKNIDIGDANIFDKNEYFDHIARLSDEYIEPSTEITRVKVPPKNTRVQSENVETVSAGSKVAKYGVVSGEIVENTSKSPENSDESDEHVTHVFGKSLGRPEDYW